MNSELEIIGSYGRWIAALPCPAELIYRIAVISSSTEFEYEKNDAPSCIWTLFQFPYISIYIIPLIVHDQGYDVVGWMLRIITEVTWFINEYAEFFHAYHTLNKKAGVLPAIRGGAGSFWPAPNWISKLLINQTKPLPKSTPMLWWLADCNRIHLYSTTWFGR